MIIPRAPFGCRPSLSFQGNEASGEKSRRSLDDYPDWELEKIYYDGIADENEGKNENGLSGLSDNDLVKYAKDVTRQDKETPAFGSRIFIA